MIKRISLFLGAIALVFTISSCYQYHQGDMIGGTEVGTANGPGDTNHSMPANKANGMGAPIANGATNVNISQVYTHADTTLTNHPY